MSKPFPLEVYRQRLLSRYTVDANGCWIYTGPVNAWGYGFFPFRGTNGAHRAAYILLKAPIPKVRGLRVCHTCDVRLCINPDHLWLGTQQDNIKDCSEKKRHTNGAKTHCKRGHEFTPENTLWTDAGKGRKRRSCKACNRILQRVQTGWTWEEAMALPPLNAHERGLRSWSKRRTGAAT